MDEFKRILFYLYYKLRIHQTWSRLYRFLYERKVTTKLPLLETFKEITIILVQMRKMWRPDGLKELWDATSKPEVVYHRYLYDRKNVDDCDGFAAFIANVILKAMRTGLWKSEPVNVALLTVMYERKDGSWYGHTVCLLNRESSDSYTVGYMDYDAPYWYQDFEACIRVLRTRNGGNPNKFLGYSIVDAETLKPLIIKKNG